jgi:hypothetical protein
MAMAIKHIIEFNKVGLKDEIKIYFIRDKILNLPNITSPNISHHIIINLFFANNIIYTCS